MVLIAFLAIAVVGAVLAAPAIRDRRDISLYGSIVDFNRRISNIGLLRTAALSGRTSVAAIFEEPSVIGNPPPTVRLIGPDGRPLDPPNFNEQTASAARTALPSRTGDGAPLDANSQVVSVYANPRGDARSYGHSRHPGARNTHRMTSSTASAGAETLRRRKLVFQTLLGAFGATFVTGLLPGLRVVLLASLVCAALLGAYIMLLRRIKLQSTVMSAKQT